jgi:hypothetical protein
VTLIHAQESLDARSEYVTSQDDGVAEHRINQYVIKQEIGRGSFGAVHKAKDQYGTEYVRLALDQESILNTHRRSKSSPNLDFVSALSLIFYADPGEATSRASTLHFTVAPQEALWTMSRLIQSI